MHSMQPNKLSVYVAPESRTKSPLDKIPPDKIPALLLEKNTETVETTGL